MRVRETVLTLAAFAVLAGCRSPFGPDKSTGSMGGTGYGALVAGPAAEEPPARGSGDEDSRPCSRKERAGSSR